MMPPKTGSAEVYLHEMPGGQFTNLKEQAAGMGLGHRWPEIARTYAEVNQLFGDIVKVGVLGALLIVTTTGDVAEQFAAVVPLM